LARYPVVLDRETDGEIHFTANTALMLAAYVIIHKNLPNQSALVSYANANA